jgi:hypothetical protein
LKGADDTANAGELGQTTNGKLFRNAYGNPQDLHSGALFDWLPGFAAPMWNLPANRPIGPAVGQVDNELSLATARSTDS